MKVYLIYAKIKHEIFNTRLKYLIQNEYTYKWSEDNYMYGLYAWTTSKKIYNSFMNLRGESNIYTFTKKDLSEQELKTLESEYKDSKLEFYLYSFGNDEHGSTQYIEVASTLFEYSSTVHNLSENLYEFGPSMCKNFPIFIFNTEIKESLENIGYLDYFLLYFGDDGVHATDVYDYQKSFGCSYNGGPESPFLSETNQLGVLIYLYDYMFTGYSYSERKERE